MPSTLSNPDQMPNVQLSTLRNFQQEQEGQQQAQMQYSQQQHLRQQRHPRWSSIAIAPTTTECVTGAVNGRVSTTETVAATAATLASAAATGAIEYPDPVVLVPVPTSPLDENEVPFVFNTNNNYNNNNSSTCTTSMTSTAATVGLPAGSGSGSGSDTGGMKRRLDEQQLLELELSQVSAECNRQAKRARVIMGSLSHLSDDEVKRMRRVKNRESVEKCRTKQRLRMEALQIEQTCLKSENQMLRATVMQIERLVSAFNTSNPDSDGHRQSAPTKNKNNKMKNGGSGRSDCRVSQVGEPKN